MWCVLLRDWNMAELVLWKEEGANQEFCCGGDPQHEREKPNRGRGDIVCRHISFEDLHTSREDQVASKPSLTKTSCP